MTTANRRIGSVPVPPLALGTMYFGTTVDPSSASECLDAAAASGATFWDTANNYAFWAGGTGDESEMVLGRWFRARGSAARDEVVVATKVGARPLPGYSDLQHVTGLSAASAREQVEGSLRRLGTDRIDVLYAHIDDRSVPLAETLGVFGELVDDGLVREVAASNLTASRLGESLRAASDHPYRALQQRFTWLQPDPAVDITPQVALDEVTERTAQAADVVLLGYSPLLSGAYTRLERPLPAEYDTPGVEQRLATLRAQALATGIDAGQLVLAWMTQRSAPIIPVVGVSRPDQVASAWHAVNTSLSTETVAILEDGRS
ncbi:aldo/keto reductase [Sanguibacter suaedae]|uniref:Aldo/keto reductase n=1 Tax=Sanguibacter suaedae TaxID=2795737 RepID=A0A934I1C8_9MICO|nr:aldo/keto reductase [Sanguibacter suaedae]MBI9113779.1 aldo/keto reductase [Sanguibacter suaedae]